MNIILPGLFRSSSLRCGISTRTGGVSPPPLGLNLSYSVGDDEANVHMNRLLFFGFLGIELDRIAFPNQVHGNTVRRADTPGSYPECDALVTDVPGVYLCVTIADCVPLFLFDPDRRAIAVVHAGWKGSAAEVTRRTVDMLRREYGSRPESLQAYIGPCASVCCYAVGEDVIQEFDSWFIQGDGDKTYLDLKSVNLHQLVECGVMPSNVEISPHCTISDSELFHSYRRERERSGRMMGVVGLEP